jgi:6-phosphogluconate dehydrogenase
MTFAKGTIVPAERSRAEIEKLVKKYGAKGFQSGWHGARAKVEFIAQDRVIRLTVVMPENAQAQREKWRCLLLLVKAKLAAIDAKIVTFEQAFVGDIVMPGGKTVYESAAESIALAYKNNDPTKLLLGGPS